MTDTPEVPIPARLGRRQLLVTGGTTISLGAILAACGSSEEGAPGRVGYAVPITALGPEVIDDPVLMRTAQSIEYTILDVYGTIRESNALDGDAAALLERLIEDHTATADEVGDLVLQAGGEPYPCVNGWYMERVIPQIWENIDGDESAGIPPTDDPARDMLAVMDAMESMATSMYQVWVEKLMQLPLRAEAAALAARSGRHSAKVATVATGAPDAYISPAVLGEEVLPDETGLIPLYAIPSQYGSLSPYMLVIGAASAAGTRFTLPIETPSDNSYVYVSESCQA